MNWYPKVVTAGVVGLVILTAAPITAEAQENVQALKQRIKELEDRNRSLVQENEALKQKSNNTRAPQTASEEAAVPALKEIPQDDSEYQFLKLGQDKNYLKAERWRIIDQIEQAIPPLYEPIRPFHGYTLPPGAFRVGFGPLTDTTLPISGRTSFTRCSSTR